MIFYSDFALVALCVQFQLPYTVAVLRHCVAACCLFCSWYLVGLLTIEDFHARTAQVHFLKFQYTRFKKCAKSDMVCMKRTCVMTLFCSVSCVAL